MSDEKDSANPETRDPEEARAEVSADAGSDDAEDTEQNGSSEISRFDEHPEETLERLRKETHDEARPQGIQRQHERGKKTARERLDYLFDTDSFQEIDTLVERRSYEVESDKEPHPGDGVICGVGEINGRKVACFSQDFTVMGGSLSEENGKKICKVMDLAEKYGMPIIGINDSGGARIQEGVRSLASYAEIFHRNTHYSGKIPQISLIMGPCAGGAVYSPAISDFVIMVEDTSFMYVTGPDVVETVTGEQMSHRDLGGTPVHSRESGVCHLVGQDDQQALNMAVQLLNYLPDNYQSFPRKQEPKPPSSSASLRSVVPEDKTRPYDTRKLIEAFVDGGSFFELQRSFAKNIVIGFARLHGHVVGVVANQPKFGAGTLDIAASSKGARFVRLCDSFNIPIVTLEDVPGFMPGKDQETGGIIRHGAKLLYAYSEASVPLLTLITRKAYGGAYCVMASKHIGADFNFAWPIAEIAVMGPESAVRVLHGDEISQAENPQQAMQEKREEFRLRFGNPWEAARRGYIDDVITPEETRGRMVDSLEIALKAHDFELEDRPPRHGNIPL